MSVGEDPPKSNSAISSSVTDLKICIAGAGMGGLTAALALAKRGFKNIELYESAPDLGFVGAGIQLAPNMARILDRLGVWKDLEKEAVIIQETSVREGKNNSELGHQPLDSIREKYGYPHTVGHRSHLAGAIYQGCLRELSSVKFFFNTTVEQINGFGNTANKPTFVAQERNRGTRNVSCDILLAADGVKSVSRVAMLRELRASAEVQDTGSASYRIMLTREQMATHPELLALLDKDQVTRWVGTRRHIIAYPVSSKQIYNISTAQPDVNFASAPSATYTTKGSKKAMLEVFSEFCPLVQQMLQMVPEGEVCEWKLRVHAPLPTWVHGSTALLGDACHPTLPHLNQGAAQAIEDAAVLAVVLSFLEDSSASSINRALRTYENLRRDRAEYLVDMAAASGKAMQLGEGKAKEERDRQFKLAKEGKAPMPDKWADPGVQAMIFGHDCMKVAEDLMLGSRLTRPNL